ncbi:MAG: VOC family protein [Candidatus Eisenbacteria bacterium]
MSEQAKPRAGAITWCDLTVPDAPRLRDFYREVVGWEPRSEPMGEYDDFSMLIPGTDDVVAGVCHARGPNVGLPPQWLIYIIVADVEAAAARAVERGGEVVSGPRTMGGGSICVIRDPAGAVCALFQAPTA